MRLTAFPFIRHLSMRVACAGFILAVISQIATAQTITKFDLERGRAMLQTIKIELKKNYYDPSFHGIDIESRFQAAEEKIKQASSNGQIFGILAQVLIELDDSHTF